MFVGCFWFGVLMVCAVCCWLFVCARCVICLVVVLCLPVVVFYGLFTMRLLAVSVYLVWLVWLFDCVCLLFTSGIWLV